MKHFTLLLLFILILTACTPEFEPQAAVSDLPGRAAPTTVIEVTPSTTAAPSTRSTIPLPMTPTPVPSLTFSPTPLPPPTQAISDPICTPPADWETISVQPGHTLYLISRVSGVSIAELQQANCLGENITIYAGQKLAVPAGSGLEVPLITSQIDQVTVYPAGTCYEPPFAPGSGLKLNQPGMAVTYAAGQHVEIWETADSFTAAFGLLGGETFWTTAGPFCFTFVGEDGVTQARRRWQIETDFTHVSGWVDEYLGTAEQYLHTATPPGPQPPPLIEFFSVQPSNPTIFDEISLSWTVRFAANAELSGGGLDQPPLSPIWGFAVPAADLILDEQGCAALTLRAVNPSNEPVTAEQTVCVELNPRLFVEQLAVTPSPIVGSGRLPVSVAWSIGGFDPQSDSATLSWYEAGYPAATLPLTTAVGSTQIAVNVTLPGTILFRLEVSGPDQSHAKELIVPVETSCEYSRMTVDPTLPLDCPTTPPVMTSGWIQYFEGGVIFRRETSGEPRPLVVMFDNGEAFAPEIDRWQGQTAVINETAPPPEGMFIPQGEFGFVWATMPGVRERLGWATQEALSYTATWQEIASHIVLKMPDGANWRYLIYDGDWGMWLPIRADE